MRAVFFDVDKVVAETEAMIAKTIAEARGRAKTPADHRLVDLQEKMIKAILVFDRALLEAKNAGVEPHVVGQAATSPVMYLMDLLKQNWPSDAYGNFAGCLIQMVMDGKDGHRAPGLARGSVVSAPMTGGTA